MDDLKVKNDKLYLENLVVENSYKNNFRRLNTEWISLLYLNNPIKGKKYNKNTSNRNWSQTLIKFTNKNLSSEEFVNDYGFWSGYYSFVPPLKTIFVGNDFLKLFLKIVLLMIFLQKMNILILVFFWVNF